MDFEKASWRRNEPGVPAKWVRQLIFFFLENPARPLYMGSSEITVLIQFYCHGLGENVISYLRRWSVHKYGLDLYANQNCLVYVHVIRMVHICMQTSKKNWPGIVEGTKLILGLGKVWRRTCTK